MNPRPRHPSDASRHGRLEDFPRVGIVALTHGNETVGLDVFERIRYAGLERKLLKGSLDLITANAEAYEHRENGLRAPRRYLDEDLNRAFASGCDTHERRKADALKPLLDRCDVVLDLHSTGCPSDSMILCASDNPLTRRIVANMRAKTVVEGIFSRLSGMALAEYHRLGSPERVSIVLEAGQHSDPACADEAYANVVSILETLGMLPRTSEKPAPEKPVYSIRHCHYARSLDVEYRYSDSPKSFDRIEAGTVVLRDDGVDHVATETSYIIMPTPSPNHIGEELHYLATRSVR